MRPFVYGRPAVEGGDRGYRIFNSEGFEAEELKRLKNHFSDEDPEIRDLDEDHFKPFFAWFPWEDGQWVFGVGRIEARGRLGAMYYSYLFHGIVLDEGERQALGYNPFVLADFFSLGEEDRGQPPHIPAMINETGRYLNIIKRLRVLMGRGSGPCQRAGAIAANCNEETTIQLAHHGDQDANFWCAVLFLIPPGARRNISLCSWQPFLQSEVRVAIDPRLEGLTLPARHPLGELLIGMSQQALVEKQMMHRLRTYEAASEDLLEREGPAALEQKANLLENLFRAMERPSVRSLEEWPPAGRCGFDRKLAHFLEVWRQNGGEHKIFPDLPRRLLQPLLVDFRELPRGQRAAAKHHWKELFALMGDRLEGEILLDLLSDELICHWLGKHVDEAACVAAILETQLDTDPLLTAFLGLKREHAHWPRIARASVTLLWQRTLQNQFQAKDTPLEALYHADKDSFLSASAQTIYHRQLGFAGSWLKQRAFAQDLIESWLGELAGTSCEPEREQLAWLRLLHLATAVQGQQVVSQHPQLRQKMQQNGLLAYYHEEASSPLQPPDHSEPSPMRGNR